jgi:hypothetical protein
MGSLGLALGPHSDPFVRHSGPFVHLYSLWVSVLDTGEELADNTIFKSKESTAGAGLLGSLKWPIPSFPSLTFTHFGVFFILIGRNVVNTTVVLDERVVLKNVSQKARSLMLPLTCLVF